MIELNRNLRVKIYTWPNIPASYNGLLYVAESARQNAQAPYSNYKVGAAVLTTEDRIFKGCNVERVSYTQTTHAEQNAIDNMIVSKSSRESKPGILAMAIIGAPASWENAFQKIMETPVTSPYDFKNVGSPSCGHCLQIIWENCFGNPNVQLIWPVNGGLAKTTIGDAFPLRFGPADLGIDYSKK